MYSSGYNPYHLRRRLDVLHVYALTLPGNIRIGLKCSLVTNALAYSSRGSLGIKICKTGPEQCLFKLNIEVSHVNVFLVLFSNKDFDEQEIVK